MLEKQGDGDRDLPARDTPDEKGGPGIWQGLVIHLIDEGLEIQEFAYARVQEKHYQKRNDTLYHHLFFKHSHNYFEQISIAQLALN